MLGLLLYYFSPIYINVFLFYFSSIKHLDKVEGLEVRVWLFSIYLDMFLEFDIALLYVLTLDGSGFSPEDMRKVVFFFSFFRFEKGKVI